MKKDTNCPIVAFTAGKGGCGKTTLSVNFAYTIFKAGKKVLLIDFDLSNRGSSGLFGNMVNADKKNGDGALIDLLNVEDKEFNPDNFQLTEIEKDKYYFLPASKKGSDVKSEIYESIQLADIIRQLKERLNRLAVSKRIDCIVLDCFCGIDILTTAAVCLSENAVFINEPDIVTFTGTVFLHRHILEKLKTLPDDFSRPKIHLVINRMRSEFSVAELNIIYENNLLKEFPNGAECHFPYNERIFKNFGKYPFWEDLIPFSLFVTKMKLLTWQIFKNSDHEDLLRKDVENWTEKKVAKIYLKSKDYNAIDSETLVMKLTNLAMYTGLLIGIYFLFTSYVPFLPFTAAIFLLSVFILGMVVAITNIIWPMILITRLNFSIATFQYRLRRFTSRSNVMDLTSITYRFVKTFIMAISVAVVVVVFWMFILLFKDDVGLDDSLTPINGSNPFGYLMNTTIPEAVLDGKGLFDHFSFSKGSYIQNINFTDSAYAYNLRQHKGYSEAEYDSCTFYMNTLLGDPNFKNTTIKNSLIVVNNFQSVWGSGIQTVELGLLRDIDKRRSIFYPETLVKKTNPDSTDKLILKFGLLVKIDSMETGNKSLNRFVVFRDSVKEPVLNAINEFKKPANIKKKEVAAKDNIFANFNRFISRNDFYSSQRQREAKLLFFYNNVIPNFNYRFREDQNVVFINTTFTHPKIDLHKYFDPAKSNCISTLNSKADGKDSTFNSSLNTTLAFMLRSLTNEPADANADVTDLEDLANLTEANIVVGEDGLNPKIAANLAALLKTDKRSYSYKYGLFLTILWKLTTQKSKAEVGYSLRNWVKYCTSVRKTDEYFDDSWSWEFWDAHSVITLNLNPKEQYFIKCLSATENDKFHGLDDDKKMEADLVKLNIAFKAL